MFVFRTIWCALFSCNTRFEIRHFALLPTKHAQTDKHLYLCTGEYRYNYANMRCIKIEKMMQLH